MYILVYSRWPSIVREELIVSRNLTGRDDGRFLFRAYRGYGSTIPLILSRQ